MIGGFIIGGTNTRHLAIRAIGPSLAAAGVTNPLLDPCWSCTTKTACSWKRTTIGRKTRRKWRRPALRQATIAESVIVTTLSPSNYTAIVRGLNGTTGVALVEAYDIP